MTGEKKCRKQNNGKYSIDSNNNHINNSKALGVMALIALLLLFQIVTFVAGKLFNQSEQTKQVQHAPGQIHLFHFNPNTIGLDSLQLLGFSQKQAQSILNYRAKGGVFRVKSDFSKMYVVDSAKYNSLKNYILLPDKLVSENPKIQPKTKSVNKGRVKKEPVRKELSDKDTSVYGVKVKLPVYKEKKINLNSADSTQLVSLYGIGPYFAKKILQYRQRLGGSFADIRQLMEIDRFTQDKFNAIKDRIQVNDSDIIKFSFWEADKKFLSRHPYIGTYRAKGILLFLQKSKELERLSGKELLQKMEREKVITSDVAKRLEKYMK